MIRTSPVVGFRSAAPSLHHALLVTFATILFSACSLSDGAAGEEGVSWGNHRAVVLVEEAAGAQVGADPATAAVGGGSDQASPAEEAVYETVLVTIPWRRRDADPASKGVIVVDAASSVKKGEKILQVLNETKQTRFDVALDLDPAEREVVLSGGRLNHFRKTHESTIE